MDTRFVAPSLTITVDEIDEAAASLAVPLGVPGDAMKVSDGPGAVSVDPVEVCRRSITGAVIRGAPDEKNIV